MSITDINGVFKIDFKYQDLNKEVTCENYIIIQKHITHIKFVKSKNNIILTIVSGGQPNIILESNSDIDSKIKIMHSTMSGSEFIEHIYNNINDVIMGDVDC